MGKKSDQEPSQAAEHPDVDPQAQAVLVYAAAVGAVLLSYSGVIDGEFDTLSRELKATLERGVVMKQPPSAQ